MAHPQDKRRKARGLYVQSRMAMPVIAVTLDVSEGTLRRWKAEAKISGDCWDMARAASTMHGEGYEALVTEAVEGFTVMFQVTMEQIRDAGDIQPAEKVKMMASLSDAFNKMINAAGRASPKLSKFGVATDVLKRMAEFIQREFPHHADTFMDVLEPFGLEISKAYNASS